MAENTPEITKELRNATLEAWFWTNVYKDLFHTLDLVQENRLARESEFAADLSHLMRKARRQKNESYRKWAELYNSFWELGDD